MNWRDILPFLSKQPAAQTQEPAAPQDEVRAPSEKELREGSIAWSELSAMLADAKYNPDDLIGRKGFDIYKKMMFDEQVKSVMYFKRSTVTGREYYFELDHEKYELPQKEAKRRCDIYTAMFEDGNYKGVFVDGMNSIMKAMWQGYSMTEQNFGQFTWAKKTWWGLRELRPKPFDTFFPITNDKGDVLNWEQRYGTVGRGTTVLPMAKFVYYRYNPDVDEHYGGSELRAAYRPFLSKDITIRYKNIYMERFAAGFAVAKPQEGHTLVRGSPTWNALTSIMANITGKSSIILPEGIDLEIIFAGGNAGSVFKESIEGDDQAIARAALVPNLIGVSPSGQTGSYSQSDTQFDVFMITSNLEAVRLQEALNEQVFAPLGRVNFPDGIAPKFCFKPLSKRQAQQTITMWRELVAGKAVQPSDTDEAHLRKLLEMPEKGEVLVDPAAPASTPSDVNTPFPQGDDGKERPAPIGQGENSDEERDKKKTMSRAFSRAQQRVAFKVIERQADSEHRRLVDQLEDSLADVVAEAVTRIELSGMGGRDSEDEIGRFTLDGNKMRGVETAVLRALRSGMEIGNSHSKREVETARGKNFSRRLDMRRLGEMSSDWMKSKSFTIAGDLRAGVVKEVKGALVKGLKETWSQDEIKKQIYRGLVNKGVLGGRSAAEALSSGDTDRLAELLSIRGGLEPHRLDTVIRTNMFEAINEARLNTFTDPEMGDFVVGLEYSAILDERTTSVCSHMDGRAYSSAQWQNELRPWVPPNHFNCRSILVPITQLDEDQELDDDMPRIEPQEGF